MSEAAPAGSSSSSSLWNSLQCDYLQQHKRSVRACLRSKQLPCPQVSKLLLEQQNSSLLSPESIATTHQFVLQEILPTWSRQRSPDKDTDSSSSLSYMSQMGTVLRFVQLLLEWNNTSKQPLHEEDSNSNSNSNSNANANHSMIPQAQLDKWAATLLLQGSKHLVQLLSQSSSSSTETETEENRNQEEDTDAILTQDASISFHASTVACFWVGSLVLRFNQKYAKRNLSLCLALWKSVDPILVAMGNHTMPLSILDPALQALTSYLNEGTHQLMEYGSSSSSTSQPQPAPQVVGQAKLLQFFVARAISICQSISVEHISNSTELPHLLESLVTLMGSVDDHSYATQTVHNHNHLNRQHQHPVYSKLVTQIQSFWVQWIIVTTKTTSETESETDDSTTTLKVCRPALDQLLQVSQTSFNFNASAVSSCENNHHNNTTTRSRTSRIMGMASLCHHLLQAIVEQNNIMTIMNEETVSSSLILMEAMLRSVLPQCQAILSHHVNMNSWNDGSTSSNSHSNSHSNFNSWSTQMVSGSLQLMAQWLLRVELLQPQNVQKHKLYALFLQWMSPSNSSKSGSSSKSNHQLQLHNALSRELVLSLLESHVRVLHEMKRKNHVHVFLKFLVQVLWDARTHPVVRETVAALMLRLNVSLQESEELQQLVADELVRHHQRHVESFQQRHNKKKRKRSKSSSSSNNHPNDSSGMLISKVLSIHECSIISRVLSQLCTNHQQALLEGPLQWLGEHLVSNNMKRQRSFEVEWSSYLLSCLGGVLRTSTSSQDAAEALCQSILTNNNNMSLARLVETILNWPQRLLQQTQNDQQQSSSFWSKSQCLLTVSVMQFYRTAILEGGGVASTTSLGERMLPQVLSLISMCMASSAPLLTSKKKKSSSNNINPSSSIQAVLWEVPTLLGSMAGSIPANCPKAQLKVCICMVLVNDNTTPFIFVIIHCLIHLFISCAYIDYLGRLSTTLVGGRGWFVAAGVAHLDHVPTVWKRTRLFQCSHFDRMHSPPTTSSGDLSSTAATQSIQGWKSY